MELTVYNIKGEKTGKTVNLSDSVFNIEPNDHAIYLDTKQYLANQRQGTHSSKEKSTVSGSTRKLKRQKGTGGARAGSIKSPLMRGGARVFGPQPRDYGFKLNKKLKQLARMSALSHKAKDNGIVILEDFSFDKPKTRNFIELLNNLQLSGKKTLMVLSESDKTVYLSSRNLKQARVIRACDLNTYEILRAHNLVILESSVAEIEKIFEN
ncbi:50S ribosomal protein L4 [Lentimicrobium sp.]|jgi:large subunit ribosomal protein L4|uniref:50S ribosomal protein L4 n=1 Tax=Lentimicrobium sp. TaxID=2034841 RepID=UPI0025CED29E|nr:50S ribosomal protein L4 [Lentimicrobium sp.]MCO5256008.1 50S ribosomal protein L4 [Lentimicrobium sp.]MCO5262791.1 50S ribosomal protein L4 [Lentimicrobium sp.]HPF64694.1 50S ribosomal protein L4 [Lentimicrobium sp.]HPJ61805.1 50S ribosomal protein L4 [Lentimicrobium sp.]HPR25921.1 50S ribosomal protein L4 [Lentimicrobium sp.]